MLLMKKLVPTYFAPAEVEDYRAYLNQEVEDYFVVEKAGKLLAAGGINYFLDQQMARLSWDFVDLDVHGKGIGRLLTQHRLDLLQAHPQVQRIQIRTSQLAYQFYQKFGFELQKTESDFWATGLDLYQMVLYI